MNLPRGTLLRKRVVSDIGTVLATVLDDEVTGYLRLEPQDVLLLDAEGTGVLTVEDGIPATAYHTGTGTGGIDALSHIAVAGPYRVELYRLDTEILDEVHGTDSLSVRPGLPAEQVAGDPELAERTRVAAPQDRVDPDVEERDALDAVETFLEDEETVEEIKSRAREEAARRADRWGLGTADQT